MKLHNLLFLDKIDFIIIFNSKEIPRLKIEFNKFKFTKYRSDI